MKAYTDFYGGELLEVDAIDGCKTFKELAEILRKHESFMEDMLCDAMSHMGSFKKRIGISESEWNEEMDLLESDKASIDYISKHRLTP